jgi:glycosyltransferase involved in cell wall biosynthesis
LGIADRVRFLGFVNQTQLPALYTASDLMVLPSSYEAFGVVVNEAYMCGCPVVASDHVGAARDLIAPVNPGLIYPCGDVSALARILRDTLQERTRLAQLGQAARLHMESWSPRENIAGTVEAVALGVARVKPTPGRKGDSSLPASQRLS